jgi:hypothetical protein
VKVSGDEILKLVKNYNKIFIVRDDMTYDVKNKGEVNSLEELGILGFALTNGRGIEWLRIGENIYVKYSVDLSRNYAHPSLGRKGMKIGEVT